MQTLAPVPKPRRFRRRRGAAFITALMLLGAVAIGAGAYLSSATQTLRDSRRRGAEIQTTHLCEAGVQSVLRELWQPFKATQNFGSIDAACSGASESAAKGSLTTTLAGVGMVSAGVVAVRTPDDDNFSRLVTIRSVGWVDRNGNGKLDANESTKVVDVTAQFQLARSQVFDYQYFVNNFGWMDGFNTGDLVVNGDMRANGDFKFSNGTPTVNGSVLATLNEKLSPVSPGKLTGMPVKATNPAYAAAFAGNDSADDGRRWRQPYDPVKHGARGSAAYDKWREVIFDSDASIQKNKLAGAALGDVGGVRSWTRTDANDPGATTPLDSAPVQEVVMPDLSDLSTYTALSASFLDNEATFQNGVANPGYGKGASLDVWNPGTSAYVRLTTNGVVPGSAVLVGTDAHPIKIHGPVTFGQDVLIKGTVTGQGTIYAGRNVHIVGSVRYANKPSFKGSDPVVIDAQNQASDMLGLAARGSIIMGKTTDFNDSYPLQYMTPPFTKGRYDAAGNWIPPFNAKERDASGFMRYQTVLGDAVMNSVAEGINQIDAVLYTNFVGGGNIGTGGGGVTFNGSIISKDEAMVVFSLPMRCNYDARIRERALTQKPLIDIKLPRSPVMLRSTWQDRGFSYGS